MRKPKKSKKSKSCSPKKSVDWVEYVNNHITRLVVPVGPRFQATMPDWSESRDKMAEQKGNISLDDSRWLGTGTWPISGRSSSAGANKIGKGRPDSCTCVNPGSVKCVKQHIAEERKILRSELGPAFREWKFDTMGDEVSKSWTGEQQKKFGSLMSMNLVSQDKTFLKPALKSFPSKSHEDIVNYYLNVYIPQRIDQQIRSGTLVIDTDDETEIPAENSPKRSGSQVGDSSKNVKPRYLLGRR